VLVAVLAAGAVVAPAAFAARPSSLTTGFGDPIVSNPSSSVRVRWLARMRSERAKIVRVAVSWETIEPQRPQLGSDATDPSNPAYDFSTVDPVVREASDNGLQIVFELFFAPKWAEGPNMPAGSAPGAWQPNATWFGAAAAATARRYSGGFPDPARPGHTLPRIRLWQPWNEPNLTTYLEPQWISTAGGFVPASPAIYRALLNSFYNGVKAVDPRNVVISAGLSPYGSPPGSWRIPPIAFERSLLCLDSGLNATSCPNPAHFDAFDHHPYSYGSPSSHAANPDDATVPEITKMISILRRAVATGGALPAGRKAMWTTEIGWQSRPPNPAGVSLATQARWVEQAMFLLWRQGVGTILSFQITDQVLGPNLYQEGLYYLSGRPKPAATAFRFPFVTQRVNRTRLDAWGQAPQSGKLTIELQGHRRWLGVAKIRVRGGRVFDTRIRVRGRAVLRARIGKRTTLPWKQTG
jgi:hypothetical protein